MLVESHVCVLVTTNNTALLPKNPTRARSAPEQGALALWIFHGMAGLQLARARSRWQSKLHIPESLSFSLCPSLPAPQAASTHGGVSSADGKVLEKAKR